MTIRLRENGRIIHRAYFFGFNGWARAWIDTGWCHWPSSEFEVIEP